jgi:mannose-6-phosphate isomerase
MLVAITNTPRNYAWGSTTAIAALLGREPSGSPEAELWLGTHPGSPARLVRGGGELGGVVPNGLPYLLKVLAAASPLSLQAHPTIEVAREGFARENAQGIAIDAAHRNYKDANHKPELILALHDGFRALCGFRPAAEVRASLQPLAADLHVAHMLRMLVDDSSIRAVFTWLITGGPGIDSLVASLSRARSGVSGGVSGDEPGDVKDNDGNWPIVALLSKVYPGDPGIAISLMLNAVTLNKGEALYLPAGNIHAYIDGLGVELMAASDNVLRGGLTPKYVDVPELVRVLDFRALPVPYLVGVAEGEAVTAFTPPIDDFALRQITRDAEVSLAGPALVLCTDGEFAVVGSSGDTMSVEQGQALYVSGDEWPLSFVGAGLLFVATTSL